MSLEILTKEDLKMFRLQLLDDLSKLLNKGPAPMPGKVLKSADVRRLLQVSPATLQKLRVEGMLPFTKIGGTLYYRMEDINRLLNGKGAGT